MSVSSLVSGLELYLWRHEAKNAALAQGVPTTEVDWLLQSFASLDSLSLRLETFKEQSHISLSIPVTELNELWQLRLQERMPVQYLVGLTPWRRFQLQVSPDVLIPRPETEYIIDLVLQATETHGELKRGNWVDLGTGSGAIALGLAEVLTEATIYATDISEKALAIAQKNAKDLDCQKIQFRQGYWWEPLAHLKNEVSGMVSNPPYIPTAEVAKLQPEIVKHEPLIALDGGDDGLDCIRHLINTAGDYLHAGGVWLIEMMDGQATTIVEMLKAQGSYQNIQIFPDLAGRERFALAYKL